MMCFLRGGTLRISVVYIGGGEEYEEVDRLGSTIIVQRSNLTYKDRLLDILPPANSFIGMVLATCLSNSNIEKNIMVFS
jgi:hypothetical protein